MEKIRKFHGWIFLDKPSGYTSNKILQKVRKLFFHEKAGFVGTLDPMASGFLPIALGKATKIIKYMHNLEKEYVFTVCWGVKTSTGDREGEVLEKRQNYPNLKQINKAINTVKKYKKQTPPRFSAIKVGGKRAYKLAREGIQFKLKDRTVDIVNLKLEEIINKNEAKFYVKCSAGTYVRSLAEKIAEECGTICYLIKLRRTGFGKLDKNLISLDSLSSLMHIDKLILKLKPVNCIFKKESNIEINYKELEVLKNGGNIIVNKEIIDKIHTDNSNYDNLLIASYKRDFLIVGQLVNRFFYPKKVLDLLN